MRTIRCDEELPSSPSTFGIEPLVIESLDPSNDPRLAAIPTERIADGSVRIVRVERIPARDDRPSVNSSDQDAMGANLESISAGNVRVVDDGSGLDRTGLEGHEAREKLAAEVKQAAREVGAAKTRWQDLLSKLAEIE